MKNGFSYSGTEIEAQGGSYGRVSGGVQFGKEKTASDFISPHRASRTTAGDTIASAVRRFYGDLGWKGDRARSTDRLNWQKHFGVVGQHPFNAQPGPEGDLHWPQTTQKTRCSLSR